MGSEWQPNHATSWSRKLRDRIETAADLVFTSRPNGSVEFLSVLQEYQRRPQLDVEGASEWPAATVLDLEVTHPGAPTERGDDYRLRGTTIAAPRRAELEN